MTSHVVTQQQVIEVPVEVHAPLDRSLTEPLDEPPAPPALCVMYGLPAVCASDGLAQIELWRGVVQQCNADRATAAKISTPSNGDKGKTDAR